MPDIKTATRLFLFSLIVLMPPMFESATNAQHPPAQLRFFVSFPATISHDPLDGRIMLLVSTDNTKEPRFQINEDLSTQQVFGTNVDGLKPRVEALVDSSAFGYPLSSLSDLKPGDYWIQALLHRYETFKRSDGHTVKLPMDRGEGQQWNSAPGNLYSTPQKITVRANDDRLIKITLDKVIPPIEAPKDTKYIKHVRIESKLLSKFWGRPMYLGANVLLPEGFDNHPNAHYPLVIFHGHFPADFGGFRETPPDPNL